MASRQVTVNSLFKKASLSRTQKDEKKQDVVITSIKTADHERITKANLIKKKFIMQHCSTTNYETNSDLNKNKSALHTPPKLKAVSKGKHTDFGNGVKINIDTTEEQPLTDDEMIPPTPNSSLTVKYPKKRKTEISKAPVNSSAIKSKLQQINAVSRKQKRKSQSISEGNSAKNDVTKSLVLSNENNKSVEKRHRKLCLTKPLKRRCSFSPDDKNCKEIDKIECSLTKRRVVEIGDAGDFLSGYMMPDRKEQYIEEKLTNVKNKKNPEPSLDDSLMCLMDEINETKTTASKSDKPHDQSLLQYNGNLDDSLLGVNIEDALMEPKKDDDIDTFLYLWMIKDIRISKYEHSSGYQTSEKILKLVSCKDNIQATCHLRDDWLHMEVEGNDIAYVSGLSKIKLSCILDNKSAHHITIYPNTLVSGTSIAAGITCERQAVLDVFFKMDSENKAMLLGSMIHELFQWALEANNTSAEMLENKARKTLQSIKCLEMLYSLDVDETEMLSNIRDYFVNIDEWFKVFVRHPMGREIEFKTGKFCNTDNSMAFIHIDEAVDIEENIWSPIYGLKGKVDVSVDVTIHRRPKVSYPSKQEHNILPLELKTGKMLSKLGSVEHRAQVAIYMLLMSEKYNKNINTGFLYYIKPNHMQTIPLPDQEKRALLIKRNSIARKLTLEKKNFKLPGLLRNERQCKRCFQNMNCMLCFKALEGGDARTSGVDEIFTNLTSHLTPEDLNFFSKWFRLSMMEASHTITHSKGNVIWADSSNTRESKGCCFCEMKIIDEDKTSDGKLHYKFTKYNDSKLSLNQVTMVVGDRVIISEQNSKVFNITTGYIVSLSSDFITISTFHNIKTQADSVTYRIDKDETLSSHHTPLGNLCKLFTKGSSKDLKLRELIIQGRLPTFSEDKAAEIAGSQRLALQGTSNTFKSFQGKALNNIFTNLNEMQKSAIERCLVTDDYIMILGMPGAGKSTTISCLVRALVAMGKSVLLTSYTHSAVDTILLKLINVGFEKFLRLGLTSRVHDKVLPYSCNVLTKNFTSTHQLREFYNSYNVVATTCLGINHAIFKHKSFDYCIVDEASQITQPVCIGPIRCANAFILVGDHNQLPPLVQSTEARERGLDISLFRALSELHPKAVVTLPYQYRMNESIMSLANELFYNDRMVCGDATVATSTLELPMFENVWEGIADKQLLTAIDPKRAVVYLDTDATKLRETKTAAHLVNYGEARIVKNLVDLLLKCGLNYRDIGVISPYRHQLKVIRQELESLPYDCCRFIEVDTVDKYQGKDKCCVILCLVRSNENHEVGELLRDWRRINVAITRAKKKLLIIGSKTTVASSEVLRRLLEIIDRKDWRFMLKD